MDWKMNPKTGDVIYVVEDEDDCNEIRLIAQVMNMEGWKVLEKYLKLGREAIIDSAKNMIDEDRVSRRISQLKGFDNCRVTAEFLVEQARAYEDKGVKEEQSGHDEG